jgi:hypothetical protein
VLDVDWGRSQASRSFCATVNPIATNTSSTSNFFMAITPGSATDGGAGSVPYDLMAVVGITSVSPHHSERLRPTGRAWLWLPAILVVTCLAIAPFIAPIALLAWSVNLARFWRVVVTVDDDTIRVGRKSAPLGSLDLTTLGRAQNTWPWRVVSRRWLGANPIWTRDSVGIRGFHEGKPLWVSVGTDHRDALVDALTTAIPAARANAGTSDGGWHADPWDPTRLRWWDGARWTGWTWPTAGSEGIGDEGR